ncbi:MAG: tyrosine-protein phosphatase [Candidatus Hydrogenedentes bacterium]|nr:tyrosine-protein phosphatase [Candidatus Hydrogenedentota bacterium]
MQYRSLYTLRKPVRSSFAVVAALAVTHLVCCAYLDHNFRTVEAQTLYRSGQLPASRLEKAIEDDGIRTVISLRHPDPDSRWYREEREACERHDVAHFDLPWSKEKLPEPESLAQFVKWCLSAEKPILVHCQGGTHRSGVASAVYLLLQGKTVDEARKQFGPFFDNAPIGTLLDLYDGSKPFAEWVNADYPRVYAKLVPKEAAANE